MISTPLLSHDGLLKQREPSPVLVKPPAETSSKQQWLVLGGVCDADSQQHPIFLLKNITSRPHRAITIKRFLLTTSSHFPLPLSLKSPFAWKSKASSWPERTVPFLLKARCYLPSDRPSGTTEWETPPSPGHSEASLL